MNAKYYIAKNSIKLLLAILFTLFMIGAVSCEDDNDEPFNPDGVAINNAVIRVADSMATTKIIVFSNGNWTASVLGEPDWLTLSQESGNGRGEFYASFTSNKDQMRRAARIIVKGGGKTDTIHFQQNGIVPIVNIPDEVVTGIGFGGNTKTAVNINIPTEYVDKKAMYVVTPDQEWITDITVDNGYLNFILGTNLTGDQRFGQIILKHMDAFGLVTKDSITVKQTAASPGVLSELKDFNYIRSLSPGEISQDICFEGYVISDKGNPNMALNTNSALNTLDKTENQITSYIQSTDGTMGFRIKAKTPGDNVFARNEKVRVWLKGTILVKESDPECYTITGVTATHLITKEDPVTINPREKYMSELTDKDMYTYVKLKDVEFSIPVGTYANIHETYITRTDGFPSNMRDKNGSSMYLMINGDVSYRRIKDVNLPKGSGTISGIVVYEKPLRYGTNGDIGKYALRPVNQNDIQLAENIENGFSTVIAEWADFSATMTPEKGSELGAKLTHSSISAIDETKGETANDVIYPWVDFNGLDINVINGRVLKGSYGLQTYWWNTTTNSGESWNIELSTATITKQLSIQISASVSVGGPRNWFLEYSTDGSTFNTVPDSDFTLQDMVNYNKTLYTQVPGHKVVNINLPQNASGKAKLYIRIKVKDTTAGNDSYDTGYSISGVRTAMRFGHITIKCNK